MAEITQTLGFDVSQALESLSKLDKALASANQGLEKFAKTTGAFNRANKAIEGNLNASNRAAQRLTVSWGYLTSRILYTQFVVSYFGKFRRTLEEAASSAVDYQRKIAEISTIAPGQSFEQLSSAVRKVSEEFNIPLLEAAAGEYQTLSNGITGAAESLEFLGEAARFSKATASSLSNSVDLLSSAVKSFGLATDDTGKAAGVLFEAIRAGRITASELGPTFGRIGPRAAQLGLSLEETAAALAAITVRGVKTSEAITQLNGVITAISKPTREMSAALRRLYFSSGEAAVATLKLPGLLKALSESTDGTSESLAKLFPNMRGIGGQLALTGKGMKEFVADLEAMEKAGANLAASKYLQATATDAEKVTKELNKVKTALTVDLGQSVLKAAADLGEFIGGADAVIEVAKAAGPVLLGLGAGFIALRGSIAASRLELALLSKGLGWLALLPIAYGAGSSIGKYIGSKMVEDSERSLRQLEKANEESLAVFKRQQSERRDAASKADEKRVESALRVVRELNKAYLAETENAQRANDAIVKNAQAGLRSYLTARERLVDELARAAAEANDAIKTSQQRIVGLVERQEERDFAESLFGVSDANQVYRMLERAQDMAGDAGRALSEAVDKDQIASALRMFERAWTTGEQAESIAQRIEDRNLEVRAANTLRDITDQQIRAEEQLQELQANRAAQLEKERVAQQKVVESIREQIAVVLANSKVFTPEGALLPAEDLAKQAAARQTALQKIAASALTSKDLDLTRALGLADFTARFSAELSRDPVRLAFDTEQGIKKAQADIQRAFDTFKLKVWVDTGVPLETLQEALGKELKTPDEVARGLTDLRKRAGELRAEMDAATASQQSAMMTAEATAKAAAENLDRIAERLKGGPSFSAGFKEAEKALGQFRAALKDPELDKDKLRALADAARPLTERVGAFDYWPTWNAKNLTDFSIALEALIKRSKALETLKAPLPDANELQRLEKIIDRLKVPDLGPAVQSGVEPSRTIATNLWSAAQATSVISRNLATAPNVVGKALGGMIHLAGGGAARGTDRIPAMLSAGEFIVNAKSARRFLPQLTAINAGQTPVYRETGGNVTVGDVSISVVESKGPRATGREVMKEFRREIRRGSGRL